MYMSQARDAKQSSSLWLVQMHVARRASRAAHPDFDKPCLVFTVR